MLLDQSLDLESGHSHLDAEVFRFLASSDHAAVVVREDDNRGGSYGWIEQAFATGIEVIAVILHPTQVEELFKLELSTSDYTVDYNIKQIDVDRLLTNFKESINILLDNPNLADERMIETKLKEFVLLITKSQNAPSQLDFLSALFKPLDIEFKSTIQHNIYSNLSLDLISEETDSKTERCVKAFRK